MRAVIGLTGTVALLMCCEVALGGVGLIVLTNPTDPINPNEYWVDLDPATPVALVFEVVVDHAYELAGGFEWQLGLASAGLAFDAEASEAATAALATDPSHVPPYLLFEDTWGFDAVLSAKGIRGSDLSDSLSTYDPVGKSLGIAVVAVTDEEAALGWHTIQDPASFLLLGDFMTTEELWIPPLAFEITPEPATLALLAVGGLAAIWRRRRRSR